jgi:hypothetical protein
MRALRGDIDARTVALESFRRGKVLLERRRERAKLDLLDKEPAHLTPEFARLAPSELLDHFRLRTSPKFFAGFDASAKELAEIQRTLFPTQTAQLIEAANRIAQNHRWPLLGYGEIDFGPAIEWRRDLLSGEKWPLEYHADLDLARSGADVRVVWELNRLAHLITLGRAYTITDDERLAEEFFEQIESWRRDNPVGRGPNWACAMEVALRAMNLLAAFQLFRRSSVLTESRLLQLLASLEQHGAHIRRNLEFSYIATSNHYLSDIAGLLWLGIMLPELKSAKGWREFALREMLREMDVQVLADGADGEASTGYHRLVLELFLYSFLICRANGIEIPEKYWSKLRDMLKYVRAYLRPDGRAPLIGDTDSGQVMPVVKRGADDHAYLLAVGASCFDELRLKSSDDPAMPEEVLWINGPDGVKKYSSLPLLNEPAQSQAFPDAGSYILRDADLYMFFNASGAGVGGRGSHGHNDSLSIEVAACGTAFITDPGTYVYRTDLHERHLFRSTAYHSTVEIDGAEQNTIIEELPFIVGDEAHSRVIESSFSAERDVIVAEHNGYARLTEPVTHRRKVEFEKRQSYWLVVDEMLGAGEHEFRVRFHFAPGIEVEVSAESGGRADGCVVAYDRLNGARLFIVPLTKGGVVEIEPRWTSRDYGAKMRSVSACWVFSVPAPVSFGWAIVPISGDEDHAQRLELIENLRNEI